MSHSFQLLFLFYVIFRLSPWILLRFQKCNDELSFDSVHIIHRSSSHLLFFTPDIHWGTSNDLALSFHSFGHSLYLFNSKCSLPRYSPLYNTSITPEQYLHSNYHQGEVIIPNNTICALSNHNIYNMRYVDLLWSLFENDSLFKQVDAIICMFYPSQCQNYLAFNKTTIFIPAHRFTIKRCNENDIHSLYKWMFERPKAPVIVMAAGRYDAEYINYYSGKHVPYIIASSVLAYEPPTVYQPEYNHYLFAPFKHIKRGPEYRSNVTATCQSHGFNCSIVRIQEIIHQPFELADINRFKAAILFPYAMLSYYIADLVTTAIPLFVPSPSMMARENIGFDARNSDFSYCYNRSHELPRHPNTKHPYSPEDHDSKAVEYWTQFASFYTPCAVVFNDYNHLATLLKSTNLTNVYKCNLNYRKSILDHNWKVWRDLFPKVERNRRFPDSLQESLQWFNETTFFY